MPIPNEQAEPKLQEPAGKFDEANPEHQKAVIDSANEFMQECLVEREFLDPWTVDEAWEKHLKRMERIGIQ